MADTAPRVHDPPHSYGHPPHILVRIKNYAIIWLVYCFMAVVATLAYLYAMFTALNTEPGQSRLTTGENIGFFGGGGVFIALLWFVVHVVGRRLESWIGDPDADVPGIFPTAEERARHRD